jgi:hypothetical protein
VLRVWREQHRLSLGSQCVLLVALVLTVYVFAGPIAGLRSGPAGLAACALAGGLCLAGALIALVAGHRLGGRLPLPGLLAGMAARMGIPLLGGLTIFFCGGPLAEAGILYYLLVFYPVTLVAEIGLSLPRAATSGIRTVHSQDVM